MSSKRVSEMTDEEVRGLTAADVAANSARRAFDAGMVAERDRIIQLAHSEAGYAEFHDCPIAARTLEDFAALLGRYR